MPELPEVETIRITLQEKILNKNILGVDVYSPGMIKGIEGTSLGSYVTGRVFEEISRRGKYLLFALSGDITLIFHLKMTGRLVYLPQGGVADKHTHVIFYLPGGAQLHWRDVRRFGYMQVTASGGEATDIKKLGPEPLSPEFSLAYLTSVMASRRGRLKSILLNQQLVAGLGNIYVDEALFAAGLHPLREGRSLDADELERLHTAIKSLLEKAILFRGTTFSDYVDGQGRMGEFQNRLKVYGKKGLPCPRCGSLIEKVKIGQRGTHFCPRCQPI